MSDLLTELIEKTKALAKDEKAMLMDVLRSELEDADAQWAVEWTAECERRVAAIDRGESVPVPADEALAQLREQLRRQ